MAHAAEDHTMRPLSPVSCEPAAAAKACAEPACLGSEPAPEVQEDLRQGKPKNWSWCSLYQRVCRELGPEFDGSAITGRDALQQWKDMSPEAQSDWKVAYSRFCGHAEAVCEDAKTGSSLETRQPQMVVPTSRTLTMAAFQERWADLRNPSKSVQLKRAQAGGKHMYPSSLAAASQVLVVGVDWSKPRGPLAYTRGSLARPSPNPGKYYRFCRETSSLWRISMPCTWMQQPYRSRRNGQTKKRNDALSRGS